MQRDYIFINVSDRGKGEPLGLPRGSIRATVTITISLACWIMFTAGSEVPNYLLNLILIMVGYYFAFRTGPINLKGVSDVTTKDSKPPLYMPKGIIRWIIIGGFILAGVVLAVRGDAFSDIYIEFYFILIGLSIGFLSRSIRRQLIKVELPGFIKHGRGIIVLSVAILLFFIFVFNIHDDVPPLVVRLSIATLGFYFGSR